MKDKKEAKEFWLFILELVVFLVLVAIVYFLFRRLLAQLS
jgi:hypothetical protein